MPASTRSLIALLQLADSSFPIGAFAHSYGLEQLVRDGMVRDATSLEAFVDSIVSLQLAPTEARAAASACRAVALGVAGAAFGAPPEDVAAALLFSTANALVQAAMRLLPISHRDAQSVLHRVRDAIADAARAAAGAEPLAFTSFHPLQEIASMRHASAPVRFFAS